MFPETHVSDVSPLATCVPIGRGAVRSQKIGAAGTQTNNMCGLVRCVYDLYTDSTMTAVIISITNDDQLSYLSKQF